MSAPAKPAVTDATSASEDELREAATHFVSDAPETLSFERCGGGVNNKVYLVRRKCGASFVLRIYNNGFNKPRVEYEHSALRALAAKAKTLPFAIPTLIPTHANDSTFVTLHSGAEACAFVTIPGGPASSSAARSMGEATARLVAALEDVTIELPLPNPLYRNIFDAHHKMNRELFYSHMGKDAEFDKVRSSTEYLTEEVRRAEALVERINAMGLPEQQIHADLHSLNVLAEGDTVTGVLDFEFSAKDWRVMELVVGLSKYVGTPGCEEQLAAYIEGYRAGGGRLTKEERSLVPELIILRILSNVVYFLGRAAAGEDSILALTTRSDMYADRIRWLRSKGEWLCGLLDAQLA